MVIQKVSDSMAKIIQFRDTGIKKPAGQKHIPYESTEMLKSKALFFFQFFDAIYHEVDQMLHAYNFDASAFEMLDVSGQIMLMTDINAFLRGEENAELIYQAEIRGEIYRAVGEAMIQEDHAGIIPNLFRWDEELGEWLVFDDGAWKRGPGAGYFSDYDSWA